MDRPACGENAELRMQLAWRYCPARKGQVKEVDLIHLGSTVARGPLKNTREDTRINYKKGEEKRV